MTWAVTLDLPGLPVEGYDAVHRALLERTGGVVDGLLVHLARRTTGGMQVIEVWRSQEDFERYDRDVVRPLAGELLGGAEPPQPVAVPFEVRGLVVPAGGVTI
jgi:hypothetical protein